MNLAESIAIGLVFVAVAPPARAAYLLFGVFVVARFGHAWAYATAQNHEIRATFFSVGSIAWAASLPVANFDGPTARITENAIRRFLDPTPFPFPA